MDGGAGVRAGVVSGAGTGRAVALLPVVRGGVVLPASALDSRPRSTLSRPPTAEPTPLKAVAESARRAGPSDDDDGEDDARRRLVVVVSS